MSAKKPRRNWRDERLPNVFSLFRLVTLMRQPDWVEEFIVNRRGEDPREWVKLTRHEVVRNRKSQTQVPYCSDTHNALSIPFTPRTDGRIAEVIELSPFLEQKRKVRFG